jgi:hypothetical protein
MWRLSQLCFLACGAALQAFAQAPLEITAPSLVYRGASDAPLEITAPALVFRRANAAPLEIAAPALLYRGVTASPREISAPALVYRRAASTPLAITAPSLIYRGGATQPLSIDAPALVFRGAALSPLQISSPSLIYRGAALQGAQPQVSTLEIIDLPTASVSSTYLSLESAAVDAAAGMTITYHGLPESRGYGGLIFMDETPPRLAAWFYTAANKPDGEYQRNILPSLTGTWKACIGFAPQMYRAVADAAQYADCLDFVVAGAGSIDAQPTLTLPDTPLKAGLDVTLTFGGLPPANCGIYIYDASGQEVARHFTNRKSDDEWTLRFAEPGTHDLTITYHGSAVRAHAKLEVTP